MDKKVAQQVEKRRRDAERRELGMKAKQIAMWLGSGGDSSSQNGRIITETSQWSFNSQVFQVHSRTETESDNDGGAGSSSELSVKFKGSVVYEEKDNQITSYVPSEEWLIQFEKLYQDSLTEKNTREEKRKQDITAKRRRESTEETKAAKKNFGLK